VNDYDPCIFSRGEGDDECIILLYVDDLMIFAKTNAVIESLIKQLKEFYKEIQVNYGIKHSYLGMTLTFSDDHVDMNMNGYIKNILDENHVNGISNSPTDSNLFEPDEEGER
jgi:hypothetical protein